MIAEWYTISATNSDLLSSPSRLASIPYSGVLTLEFQAEMSDDTNHYDVTLQLPDGSTPLDGTRMPKGATAGAVNSRDKYQLSIPVSVGGHVTVNCVETGTAIMNIRATLMP